jgi:hypothetical protein
LQENNVRPSANSSWTWQKPRTRSRVKFIPNPSTTAKVVRVASKGDTTHTGDRRSCTVHALSNVAEVPFFVAQAALRQAGRKANKGFYMDIAAGKNLIRGFRFHKVNRKPVTLGKFLAKHPVGRFLVMTPSHAFAVIHGKVVDNLNTVGANRKLTHAFTVKWDAAEDERKAPRQIVAAGGKVVTVGGQASDERGDEAIIAQCDVGVRHRRRIELQIVRKTIRTLKDAGFDLLADNGEDKTKWNATERHLIDNLFACDEAHLYVHRAEGKGSFVFFVMGNDGYDVVCDYGVSLEPQMALVNAYADSLEAEGR